MIVFLIYSSLHLYERQRAQNMSNPYMEGGSLNPTTRNSMTPQQGKKWQGTTRWGTTWQVLLAMVKSKVKIVSSPCQVIRSRLHRLFYELLSSNDQPESFTGNPDRSLTLVQIDNNPQKSSVQSKVGKLRNEGSWGYDWTFGTFTRESVWKETFKTISMKPSLQGNCE